jgi:class 3 adenylate cyclase/tetratricopeptide (TPR) repeat protein
MWPTYTSGVPVCPQCGEENPERARFCMRCGSELARPPTRRDEERKIITVLFCELVGPAGWASLDPEELRRSLAPYHSRIQQEIGNYGGTVDKFMGPTALGVFGAPVAHEDDPERAVRAALRILEGVQDLAHEAEPSALSIRIGVNTGEAVVGRPGSGPQIGEAVTGDVVNTASRIQSIAAPGQVVVGESTYRATEPAFTYEQREPVLVKGKAEPLAVWVAVGARSRMGVDLRPRPSTPFVGRREERSLLEGAFRRAVGESSVQLVTVTGEPGVGKTRLIQELEAFADEYPGLIRWRQGRCLPYGEGISFWALGEIVKADAGILESDPPSEASAKLGAAVAQVVDDATERDWLRARLAPLAGVEGATLDVPREEMFTAWRRFLEALAARHPTVLVFEDLHWADEAMLAFIEHLVDWAVDLPLLVVCAARPELYERHAGWGGGRRNATSVMLGPLTQPETAMLLSALLDRAVLPVATQEVLLDRAGGNPLYAEEFVRMLRDQGILDAKGTSRALVPAAAVQVPQTVQLLIGARLDTLPADLKALVQDAAVVGKVFWDGAVRAMGDRSEQEVRDALHELSLREFVRPSRTSSIKREAEYAFLHVLVQDVAYGHIPRAVRGAKHVAVAEWIRGVAGDRISDMAELLAHHFGEALSLAGASGDATSELERLAGSALMMAGDRAKRLDATRAEDLYRQARDVLPQEDPEHTMALVEAAEIAAEVGRFEESERDFQQAMDEYRAGGDTLGLGGTMARLARSVMKHGQEARELLEQAIELLETQPPGPELARAYTRMGGHLYVAGDSHAALPWTEKAIALADELGLDDEAVLALQYRGAARSAAGDRGGLEDLREALRLGLELGLGHETATAYNNLAYQLWGWEGPEAARAMWDEMIGFCRVRGFTTMAMWAEGGALEALFDLGDWDRAMRTAEEMLAWERSHGRTRLGITALTFQAWVHLRRGQLEPLTRIVDELVSRARAIEYPEFLAPALMIAAEFEQLRGNVSGSRSLVDEFLDVTADYPEFRRVFLPLATRVLVSAGALDEAEDVVRDAAEPTSKRQGLSLLTGWAIVAEAHGRFEEAATLYEECERAWGEYHFPLERGRSLLGIGRCRLACGATRDALAALSEAREVLFSLGARPLVGEIDDLLGRAAAISS